MPSNNTDRFRKLNEEYEDGLFRLIMDDVAEKEGRLLFEENEQLKSDPENIPSQKDVDRFATLLDSHLKKAKKIKKYHRTSKIFTRVAAAMLAMAKSRTTKLSLKFF